MGDLGKANGEQKKTPPLIPGVRNKAVNIRDFPEALHHKAKIQAAVERITLKELMIKALTEYPERKGVK